MKPLSDKATLLALLIHEATTRDEAGRVTKYWIPGRRWEGCRIMATEDVIIIGGAGDARMLAALQARGLIAQTPRMRSLNPYSFYSTEEVAVLIEQRWAWIAERKARNEREAAVRVAARDEGAQHEGGSYAEDPGEKSRRSDAGCPAPQGLQYWLNL